MITVFGASTDVGRRVIDRLIKGGQSVRAVSRSPLNISGAECVIGSVEEARTIAANSKIVVSFAHARFTRDLIEYLPAQVPLILTGSAWRYSRIPSAAGDLVRDAERAFLCSKRDGAMLHSTMIYGGSHERNIQRLVSAIKRLPVLPVPGGGRQLVQPIHVDDLASCFIAAINARWTGPHIICVAGPKAMLWREMASICMDEMDTRRPMLEVPIAAASIIASLMKKFGIKIITPDEVRRFGEDVSLSTDDMQRFLSVAGRPFRDGIRSALEEWSRS